MRLCTEVIHIFTLKALGNGEVVMLNSLLRLLWHRRHEGTSNGHVVHAATDIPFGE